MITECLIHDGDFYTSLEISGLCLGNLSLGLGLQEASLNNKPAKCLLLCHVTLWSY